MSLKCIKAVVPFFCIVIARPAFSQPEQPARGAAKARFPISELSIFDGTNYGGKARPASRMVTAEMRRNAMRNLEAHEEFRGRREQLIAAVEPFMRLSLEELWTLLPSQEMGRDAQVYRHGKGSPQEFVDHEGREVGVGRWTVDILGRPWQVRCTRTGIWYPMNDFAAYYRSALDETGRFRLGKGNPEYLRPRADVEGEARAWVDDGAGLEYQDHQWFFAAHYAWRVWRLLPQVAHQMGLLYTMTENVEYARRAAVILDRMADLYPEMDERPHRARGMSTSYGPGRIEGTGWEVGSIRSRVAWTYDHIYDGIKGDEEFVRFLDGMSRKFHGDDKSSFAAIDRRLRINLLIDMIEDIIAMGSAPDRGREQSAVAQMAACLDDPVLTPRYFDWLFREDGGRLPYVLINHMTRDGFNVNSGLGYMRITGTVMVQLANILRQYGHADYDLYRDYPLMNVFTMNQRVRILDTIVPMIGDGGSSMATRHSPLPVSMLIDGYRAYGTPEIAEELFLVLDGDTSRLLTTESALLYAEELETFIATLDAEFHRLAETPRLFRSYNSGGTGLGVLQAPLREHPRAAAINYGRTMAPSHAHADRLSLHLWAYGEAFMPDMGYPLYTGHWPKRHGWTRHTISHNTVMVNDTRQGVSYSGKTVLFADAGPVRIADIDGLGTTVPYEGWQQRIYEGVGTYRRVVVMVDTDAENSYLLDLFWVRGGENHRLIQNSGARQATHIGLNTAVQPSGTFAGPEIEYGQEHDGALRWGYAGNGFQFLRNVERDSSPPERFVVDWKIDPLPAHGKPADWAAHMRLHNLTRVDEVALADGMPSRGHPDRIRYLVRSRLGEDIETQFISVIEPYMDAPFIESVDVLQRQEQPESPFAAAVQVTFTNGKRDVILVTEQAGELEAGGVRLDGRMGFARFAADGRIDKLVGIAAAEVSADGQRLTTSPAVYSGEMIAHDDSDPLNGRIRVQGHVGHDARGEYVIFDNRDVADGSYRILSVEEDDGMMLNIGSMPLYERLADPKDFSQGGIYNVHPGDGYIIPRKSVWRRQPAAE